MRRVATGRAVSASAALLVVVIAAGCGGQSHSRTPPAAPDASSANGRPYIVASVDVGNQPCAVEGGFGSIWVSLYGEGEELRIDPATHRVIARIRTGFGPCGIAVGAGSVWVEDYNSNRVTRIDPKSNTVAASIKTGASPYDVTFADGAAWVTNFGSNSVTKVDAANNRTRTIRVGASPTGIAPAGGAIWATNMADGTVSRIGPRTLAVRTTKIGGSPSWTAWGDGRLWVSNGTGIDDVAVGSGRASHRVGLSGKPNDGDIVGGDVWVTDSSGTLHEVDASTGRKLGAWPLGLNDPFVLAGYAGELWVVDYMGTNLAEIDPAKLPSMSS